MASGLSVRELGVMRAGKAVLSDINFHVPEHSVCILIGANGAGKSTLLKAITGIVAAHGSVTCAGGDLLTMSAQQRQRWVAYVPQRSALHAALPVHAVIAAARLCERGPFAALTAMDHEHIINAMNAVDVSHFAARPFTALSTGEQQRVLLARALCSQAPYVILDEPTAALDPAHAAGVMALVSHVCRAGRTVLMAMHGLDDARRTADQVVLLHGGRVVAAGVPETVLRAPLLGAALGVTAEPGGAWAFRPVTS